MRTSGEAVYRTSDSSLHCSAGASLLRWAAGIQLAWWIAALWQWFFGAEDLHFERKRRAARINKKPKYIGILVTV
jgi:hypothetical protein